jgi:hypothetical protein
MPPLRRSHLLALLGATACLLSKPIGDGIEGESTGTTAGSASMSSTTVASATSTVDAGSSESGPVADGTYVDCAEADPSWPTVGPPEVGPLGFPVLACNPRESGEANGFRCCSDDPAAVGGELPSYQGRQDLGSTPLFADNNNHLGVSGMCVRTADIPAGFTLVAPNAAGCPVPCDPTWSDADIAAVCGRESFECCQTRELQPEDCVLDPETNQWRPATGDDVFFGLTTWSPSAHATHQDPNGVGCTELFGSMGAGWEDCIHQLHVADRRGYCMSVAGCPLVVDVCAALNR